jgi:hypothetical protein
VVRPEAYPRVEHLERCFTPVVSSLTSKHKTRLERLARDKCYRLLWKVITYGRKIFYNIGHRPHFSLHLVVISKMTTQKFQVTQNASSSWRSTTCLSCSWAVAATPSETWPGKPFFFVKLVTAIFVQSKIFRSWTRQNGTKFSQNWKFKLKIKFVICRQTLFKVS